MNKNTRVIITIVALVVIIAGTYALVSNREGVVKSPDQKMIEDGIVNEGQNTTDKGNALTEMGSYEVYAPEKVMLASATHNVVLFFRASWCPTCRALDADIRASLTKIPRNLTILDVNYDDSTTLKRKYGVTYQHTFVQVDKDGNLIKKWSGSLTLASLVAEVK